MDDRTLRRKAREAIQVNRLPNERPARMWGGDGVGAPCAVCGRRVKREEIGYDLQFAATAGAAADYHVHVHCFTAWDLARRELGGTAAESRDPVEPQRAAVGAGSTAVTSRSLPNTDGGATIASRGSFPYSAEQP